jgi:hypothetical protein
MNQSVIEYDSRQIGGTCGVTFPSMVAAAINFAYTQNSVAISNSPLVGNRLNAFASARLRTSFASEFRRQFGFCATTSSFNDPAFYWGLNQGNNTCVNLPPASNLNFTFANFPRI